MLLAHLCFLNGYSTAWWMEHFEWQKYIDTRSRAAGFLARHMAVRYFIQSDDLQTLKNGWRANDNFNDYVRYFPQNNLTYTADQLASDFFSRAQDRHIKHFEQWRSKYIYVALAGDAIPATMLANWFLQQNPPLIVPPNEYYSSSHKRTINTASLLSFLTTGLDPVQFQTHTFYRNHIVAVKEVSEGKMLWASDMSQAMINFNEYVESNWLPIVTNTQLVERWVKDSNECTYTGKDDHFASMVAICRSSTVFDYKEEANRAATCRVLKGNTYLTTGRLGERIVKKSGERESKKRRVKDVRGCPYINVVIKNTILRNRALCDTVVDGERDRVRNLLTKSDVQFAKKRENITVEKYAAVLNETTSARPNAIQNQTGFEPTTHMKGEVTYSKLGTKHVMLVREEIVFRGHIFDNKDGIRKLSTHLQAIDRELQVQHLVGTTGNANPDEDLINTKAYRPLCRRAAIYELH